MKRLAENMAISNDLISKYNFKDLSKFIEDLRFLFARGGAELLDGSAKSSTVMSKIWSWLFFFLQIIILIILVRFVYKILTGGYVRFFTDMLTFKFSNKLNMTKEFGGTNGILFKQVYEMTEPPFADGVDRVEATGIELRDIEFYERNIFQAVKDNIEKTYEPLAKYQKCEMSMEEYYLYYDVIFNSLGFDKMVKDNQPDIPARTSKVRDAIDNVIGNYLEFYGNTAKLHNDVACSFIDGKNDGVIQGQKELKTQRIIAWKQYKDLYNIEVVNTSKRFAERFPNVSDTPNCTSSLSLIYNKILTDNYKHTNLVQAAKQLQIYIRDNKNRKVSTRQERKQKSYDLLTADKTLKTTKMDIAGIRRGAMNDAMKKQEEEQQRLNTDVKNGEFTKGYFKEFTGKIKGLVNYTERDFTIPNIELQKDKNYTVYVPFYPVYHLYYNANKKRIEALYKDMKKEEIIAFLFLKDVEDIIETESNKTSSATSNGKTDRQKDNVTSVGERLMNNFWTYEKLGYTVGNVLNNPTVKDLLTSCQHINFDNESRMDAVFLEIVANKDNFIPAYASYGSNITVTDNYTYYWLEVLNGVYRSQTNQAIYEHFRNEFQNLMTFGNAASRKNSLLAFLNLPLTIQERGDVRAKFDISSELYKYIMTHPLFITVYLSSDNPMVYNKIIGLFTNIVNDYSGVKKFLLNPTGYTIDNLKIAFGVLESEITGLKKCLLSIQICNMYMSQYKNELSIKPRGNDKNNKNPSYSQFVSKVGYKTLTNDQIILDYDTFFKQLFKPFYVDFVEGRVLASWRRAFNGKKFDPKNNTGYWREFRALYVDYVGAKVNRMKDDMWRELSKFAKPRWGKMNEYDKT